MAILSITMMSWVWLDLKLFTTQFSDKVPLDKYMKFKRNEIKEILRRTWLISANKEKQNVVQNPTPAPSLLVRCMILAAVEAVLFLKVRIFWEGHKIWKQSST